jgi:hypothetical protein
MVNTCNIVLIPYWFSIATLISSLLIDFVLAWWKDHTFSVVEKAAKCWKNRTCCKGKSSDKEGEGKDPSIVEKAACWKNCTCCKCKSSDKAEEDKEPSVFGKVVECWKSCMFCNPSVFTKAVKWWNRSKPSGMKENGAFELDETKFTSNYTYFLRAKVVVTCLIDIGLYIYTIYSWTDNSPNSYHPSSLGYIPVSGNCPY